MKRLKLNANANSVQNYFKKISEGENKSETNSESKFPNPNLFLRFNIDVDVCMRETINCFLTISSLSLDITRSKQFCDDLDLVQAEQTVSSRSRITSSSSTIDEAASVLEFDSENAAGNLYKSL